MKKIQFNLVILSAFILVISSCNPVEEQVECTNCKCFKSQWIVALENLSVVSRLENVDTTNIFFDFCENNGLQQQISNGNWTVQHCSCENIEKNRVYISMVVSTPTENESVTIKNNSGSSVDLKGWRIGKKSFGYYYTFPSTTILSDGETRTFSAITLGFISSLSIKENNESIYLMKIDSINNENNRVIDIWNN